MLKNFWEGRKIISGDIDLIGIADNALSRGEEQADSSVSLSVNISFGPLYRIFHRPCLILVIRVDAPGRHFGSFRSWFFSVLSSGEIGPRTDCPCH